MSDPDTREKSSRGSEPNSPKENDHNDDLASQGTVPDDQVDNKDENVESKPISKPITYSDDPDTLQEQLGLLPTTIVLAKVKGYRAWPAMVLDFDILPENIKNMRPKSVKQAKKQKIPVIVVPVRFFSDDTYIWIKSADLKLVSPDEINTFLDKRANAKKHDTLIDAYRLAQNPPDMAEFNRWGSAGPPPDVPDTTEDIFDEDEEELDDEDEPPRKKLKLTISMKKTKASAKSSAKSKSVKKSSAKSKASAKKATTSKSKAKPSSGDDDPGYADYEEFERELDEASSGSDPEYDSDWGIGEDDFDFETGDYIFENHDEQKEFSVDFPRAKQLSSTLAYYNKQLLAKYRIIAPMLLGESDIIDKELIAELREVEKLIKLGDVPKVAFTKSKLFRSLLVTAHKPEENFPHRVVRGEIDKILKLVPLTACMLTLEDLVVHTPEETPAPEIKEEEGGEGVLVDGGEGLNGAKEEDTKTGNGTGKDVLGAESPEVQESSTVDAENDTKVGNGKENVTI